MPLHWIGMKPDILPSLAFSVGRASEGREQTVSHTQQARKYLLPNLWGSLDPYFHVEPLFFAWTTAVGSSLASGPSSTSLPESSSEYETSTTIFSCLKSFCGSYCPSSFWRVRIPFENLRSKMESLSRGRNYSLPEAHPPLLG